MTVWQTSYTYAFFPSDEKEAKYARYSLDRGESKAKVEPVSIFFYKNCFFLQVAVVFFQLSRRFLMEKLLVDHPSGSLKQ